MFPQSTGGNFIRQNEEEKGNEYDNDFFSREHEESKRLFKPDNSDKLASAGQ